MGHNFDDIKPDDLPEECRQIAELIGFDALLKLIQARGGEHVYFPKLESVASAARNRAIRDEFNGRNYRYLAKKHGLTVRWVRVIVSNRKSKTNEQRSAIQSQLSLF